MLVNAIPCIINICSESGKTFVTGFVVFIKNLRPVLSLTKDYRGGLNFQSQIVVVFHSSRSQVPQQNFMLKQVINVLV